MSRRGGSTLLAMIVVACSMSPGATSSAPSASAPATTAPPPPTVAAPTAAPVETTTTTVAPTTTTTLALLQGLVLEEVATGLSQPTVVAAPPGDARLFIAERQGVIRIVDPDLGLVGEPFLDISGQVTSTGIEQGMLGLAFHPDFSESGRFFVYYVDADARRRLSEFTAAGDTVEAGSERVVFALDQPPGSLDIRHYAGTLQFGPDGFLWASLGDGADARGQGQDPETLFGTIIRLDVDGEAPYAIPPDNPFVAGGGAPEVWAYGLRNPWRFSIDAVERLVYVADVGQETWEEVNVVSLAGGFNFGWPDAEGSHCFLDPACDLRSFTPPVLEYGHDEGCSITGGHVYRGTAIPELAGHYFYADWCLGWIRSLRFDGTAIVDSRDWSDQLDPGQVNAFGVDSAGELYLVTFEGSVFRVAARR